VLARTPHASARLLEALVAVLKATRTLREVQLSFALPGRELGALGCALGRCSSLRSLTLSGADLGGPALARLLQGLHANPQVETLRLSGCGLSDDSAETLAVLLKEHAHRRDYLGWRDCLREYPEEDQRHGGHDQAFLRPPRASTAQAAPPGERPVRGLVHLDVSCNALGLRTVRALCGALEPRIHCTRLASLDIRSCELPATAGDWLGDVMRRGASLVRADCRFNAPELAVVLRDQHGSVCHLTAPPEELAAAERIQRRADAMPPASPHASSAIQQPPMRTGGSPLIRRSSQHQSAAAHARRTHQPHWVAHVSAHVSAMKRDGVLSPPMRAAPPPPLLREQLLARPATAPASQQRGAWRASGGVHVGSGRAACGTSSAAAVSEQLLRALTRLESLLNARAYAPASPSGWAERGALARHEGDVVEEEEDEEEEEGIEFSSGDEGGSNSLAGDPSRQDAFQSASPSELRRRVHRAPCNASPSDSSSEDDVLRAIKGQLKALCGLDDA